MRHGRLLNSRVNSAPVQPDDAHRSWRAHGENGTLIVAVEFSAVLGGRAQPLRPKSLKSRDCFLRMCPRLACFRIMGNLSSE